MKGGFPDNAMHILGYPDVHAAQGLQLIDQGNLSPLGGNSDQAELQLNCLSDQQAR